MVWYDMVWNTLRFVLPTLDYIATYALPNMAGVKGHGDAAEDGQQEGLTSFADDLKARMLSHQVSYQVFS